MSLLTAEIKEQLREMLADLKNAVRLIVFTQEFECQHCRDARELVMELAEVSTSVTAEVYDLVADKEKAQAFAVEKIPALIIMGEEDYGIRFYGIPSGYEFSSLLHAVRLVGGMGSQLDAATRQEIAALTEPIHIQVFVTPTCPYCPRAVILGYEMAFASPYVRADAIEANEFPELSTKYQVAGVPRSVINETVHIEGAAPAEMLLAKIKEALTA